MTQLPAARGILLEIWGKGFDGLSRGLGDHAKIDDIWWLKGNKKQDAWYHDSPKEQKLHDTRWWVGQKNYINQVVFFHSPILDMALQFYKPKYWMYGIFTAFYHKIQTNLA